MNKILLKPHSKHYYPDKFYLKFFNIISLNKTSPRLQREFSKILMGVYREKNEINKHIVK